VAADGYARAFMDLILRVDKRQAEKELSKIDADPAGQAAGKTFGDSLGKAAQAPLRDMQTKLVADSGKAGGQSGDAAGRSFTSAFGALTKGIVTSFFTGDAAAGIRAATGAGGGAGRAYGDRFTVDAQGKLRDFQGRFVADSARSGSDAGTQAGRGFASSFARLTAGAAAAFFRGATAGGGGAGGGGSFLGRAGAQGGGRGFIPSLAAGIGPNILGLQVLGKAGLIGGAGALGLGALPALAGIGGAAGVAGLGAGALAGGFSAVQSQVSPLVQARTQAQTAARNATTPAQAAAAQAKLAQVNAQIRQLSPALQSIIASETKIKDTWETFSKSLAPLFAGPVAQVAKLLGQLTGPLRQMFAGAATLAKPFIDGLGNLAKAVLPLLGQAFRAVAPLVKPLIDALTGLLTGILPGLITIIKAATPVAASLFSFLGGLGRALGGLLTQLAPAIGPSVKLFNALFGVVDALLPVIGQLAGIFARALAPVFSQFAGIIVSLMPFLVILGKVLASLAGAILGDLVAAFKAVAGLFRTIAPALAGFATAISGVFTVLENSGVFAVIGNAIESIVGPLGVLISALLRGLTPILPPIIGFVGQLAAILAGQLGRAIAVILPVITQLVTGALGLLARFLPPLLPLITQLARQLGGALVAAVVALAPSLTQLATVALQTLAILLPVILPLITGFARVIAGISARALTDLAVALNAIVTAIPPGVLSGIAVAILAVVAGVKLLVIGIRLWAVAQAILDGELIANPIGLIVVAIAGLVIAVTELVRHWSAVWSAVKGAAKDAWEFLTHGWGQALIPGLTLIRLAAEFVRDHWRAAWGLMKQIGKDFYNWLWRDFGAKFGSFFTKTIPGWFSSALGAAKLWWRNVAGAFTSGWNTVWRNTVTPMANLFTKDLPGWFRSAVTAVGRWWGNLTAAIRGPVVKVVDTVLNGIINVFDWITSHIGLGKPIKNVHPFGLAEGGRIPGFGGGDRHLILTEGGEAVVDKDTTRAHAADLRAWGVPGFAAGGKVGQNPPVGPHGQPGVHPGTIGGLIHKVLDIAKITAALATGNSAALTNAFSDLLGVKGGGATAVLGQILTQIPKTLVKDVVGWLMANGGGASGNAIADYAMRFLGKIPYVWGGTAVPGGADCSGFVQAIYEHFKIQAPRTSEAQGAWVKRGPPQPGGLALYHSPPGGPDPGHVAIVRSASQVISQGGGLGPTLQNLHYLPLLWTGIPPGGLGAAAGGSGTGGTMTAGAVSGMWKSLGGPAWAATNMARIAFAESGDRPSAVQQGQPPGLTGWGLYQITPTSGISQGGAYGNLLNAANNTRAAISLFAQSGYGPWASDPVGASLGTAGSRRFARGGWLNEPVTGVGRYSNALYRFGEAGRELVTPEAQTGPAGGWGPVGAKLDRIASLLDAGPNRTAAGIAAAGRAPARLAAHAAWIGAR
jgi:cell wall-associated NlpC family hydrolase